MTRDELVEAVSREVFARTDRGHPNDGWSGPDDWRTITKITGIYLDVAGPLIRDHEQAYARRELLAELRARAEALPIAHHYGGERGWCVRIADVLAMIDGRQPWTGVNWKTSPQRRS